MVKLLLHVRTVALEWSAKLLYDLLHLTTDTVALLASFSDNSLRVFIFLSESRATFEGSLQILFRMTSPW